MLPLQDEETHHEEENLKYLEEIHNHQASALPLTNEIHHGALLW